MDLYICTTRNKPLMYVDVWPWGTKAALPSRLRLEAVAPYSRSAQVLVVLHSWMLF